MSDVILQIVLCVLVADFVTGVVHWFEQTYGLPSWPVLGASIEANIDHHERPAAMCCGTLWSRNYQMWALAAVVIIAAGTCGVLTWQLAVTAIVASCGNEIHSWSHGRAPSFARVLQDMGVLVNPRQHAAHHRPPYDRAFCTVTSFVNPPLDALRFWRCIEWLACWLGLHPKRMTAERRFR